MLLALKTIRARLFQLLIIAIGSMVMAIALVWQFSIEPALRLSVAKAQREVAQRAAEQIGGFIDARVRELQTTAEIGRLWEKGADRHKQTIDRLFKLAPEIQEVSLIAPDGHEQLRVSRLRVLTDDDLRILDKLEVFREALRGQVSMGSVYHFKTEEPYLSIAIPVRFTATDIRGVLKAEISLKSLWNTVSHIRVGQSGHLYVVNRKGELVAHPDYSKVLLGLNMSEVQEVEEFLEFPDGDPGFGEVMQGESGVVVMSTYARVPQTGWGVIVEEPLETALADAWKLKRLATIVLVLAVAGAFLVSYRFSRRVSDPVRDLEKGADLIARGNLEHRLVIRTGDEIESLAAKFNGMAQSLKASHESLEAKVAERTNEISSLYAALAPLSPSNSLSQVLESVIERLVHATGADAALIRLRDRRTGFFSCAAATGFDDPYLNATRIIDRGSAVARVLTEGRSIITPDILSDERIQKKRQVESGFFSCAFLPLEAAGEIRGVIHLASRTRGFFDSDKEARLITIAHQTSIAIENHELFAQTQRRHQEFQALYAITETVSRSLDLSVLTQTALVTTIDVLKLSAGRLYVFDEQDRRLRLTAHHGIPVEQLEEISSYAPGTGIIGAIFEQQEPLIFPSVREDPVFDAAIHSERGLGEPLLSSVGLPITIKERVVGVIHLYGRTVREFDAQDMEILSAIGRQIGVAIDNARLFQETVERARQQEALNAIAAATSRSLGLEELFEIALDKVLEVTGRERVSIRLRDAATGAVALSAHRGFSEAEVEDLRRRTPHRMSEQVFASGEPVVLNDSVGEGDSSSVLPRSRSVAWIPMESRANVVGVLGVSETQPNPFSRREVDFLLAVGNVIGVALENMRLYENERNQVKSLRLLVNASQKLVERVDIDALSQDILDTLVTAFGVRLAWIGSAEADGRVRPLYWAGDVAEYLRRVEIRWDDSPLGYGPAGQAIRSGQPVVMDVAADAGFAPWREAALAHGYREVAAFPLMRGAKPFGHLILYSGEPGFFTPGRVELVQTYANIATGALENTRLFQETQRSLNRIRALHEIDKAIASSLDLNVVLNVLLEQIELFLPCPASSTIRLFNRNTGLLEPVACRNLAAEAWKAWKGARGTANIVYETKTPIMIPNVQTDPQTQDVEFFAKNKLVSYLGVPLIVKDEALGVLGFYTKEERPFSQEEVEFLVTLAGQAAIAIHNSQLYGEIQKQAVELEQSNKVKDEFLNIISHELRTPLIAVMGYAGLMQEELMGKNSPEQAKAIEIIKKESEHLLAIIRQILEATRLESGAAIADKQPADLAKLLAEIEDSYRLPLGKPVALRWQYDSSFPLVCTDVMKLKQILQSLVANAIKFTEEGSITISACHSVEKQAVYFQVADTGVGIPSEMLPLIFDKFRQVDSSDTRSYEGLGLGLFIAKKFAELLGGTIAVQSEPGRGSTFTVILPCATFSAGARRLDDCVNL